MRKYSRAEIDRLGSRLSREPTEADLQQYLDYANGFEDARRAVVAVVQETAERLPPLFREVSSRIKATDSVISKLRRKEASLGEMQDIAGCRLTVPDLFDLEIAKDELEARLDIRRVKDYRREAKAGYRAVHLIVRVDDGYVVEIQLRTEVQHAWANLSETLAYEHDRLIKAGGGPQDLRKQLEQLSEQGRLIDESRDMLQIAAVGHQALLELLQERERAAPLVHELTHDVEAILSLLEVAEYNHRRLVDGFLWETETFEYSPSSGDILSAED